MAQNLVINGVTYNNVNSLELTNDLGEKIKYSEGGGGEVVEIVLQDKTVTPLKTVQSVTADSNYTGLGTVTVNAIPNEYIVPNGELEIETNGTHDVTEYSSVNVNVPVPEGYIVPSGDLEVTTNGTHDVTEYASVSVKVPSEEPIIEPLEVTENGTYTPSDGVHGYAPIVVNVPTGDSGGDSDLPEGYRRCDYILFSGKQWIDTGIVGNQDTQIHTSFTWENTTQRHLFGCASSDNTKSITSYMNGSWRFGAKSTSKSFGTKNSLLPYAVLVNKTTISTTNSATSISGVADFETVGTLLLGGARDSDGTEPSVGIYARVYFFCLWQGEEMVRKLIPVTDGNGVYRFFDKISRTFFDSITGSPLEGGDI